MIPLLFMNPKWVRENLVAAFLLGVIFLGLGMAVVDWLRQRQGV